MTPLLLALALTAPATDAVRHCWPTTSGGLECDAQGRRNIAANLREAELNLAILTADVEACRALAAVDATEAAAVSASLQREIASLRAAVALPAPFPWRVLGYGVAGGAVLALVVVVAVR